MGDLRSIRSVGRWPRAPSLIRIRPRLELSDETVCSSLPAFFVSLDTFRVRCSRAGRHVSADPTPRDGQSAKPLCKRVWRASLVPPPQSEDGQCRSQKEQHVNWQPRVEHRLRIDKRETFQGLTECPRPVAQADQIEGQCDQPQRPTWRRFHLAGSLQPQGAVVGIPVDAGCLGRTSI
jgi:hypothetical protein